MEIESDLVVENRNTVAGGPSDEFLCGECSSDSESVRSPDSCVSVIVCSEKSLRGKASSEMLSLQKVRPHCTILFCG